MIYKETFKTHSTNDNITCKTAESEELTGGCIGADEVCAESSKPSAELFVLFVSRKQHIFAAIEGTKQKKKCNSVSKWRHNMLAQICKYSVTGSRNLLSVNNNRFEDKKKIAKLVFLRSVTGGTNLKDTASFNILW